MKYRLRSDLSKTTVYMIVKQFAPAGIVLPTLRKCEFKKYRGTYWIRFYFDGHRFKAVFDSCLGRVYVSYDLESLNGEDNSSAPACEYFRRQVVTLTWDYLLNNNLLWEVA